MSAADLRFLLLVEKFLSRNPSIEEIEELIAELTVCLELPPAKDESIGELPPPTLTYWESFKLDVLKQAKGILGVEEEG